MRLISCYIENFGTLHDLTVDFTEGANVICEENGWGKSTFAAFIRAMFYGLEGERKRSIEENERKRYAPWKGGVFGGRLTFEVGEKQYTVARIFSDQDEFELRDAKTNLISNDYSRELGRELFKVNRESFMRTVFIGQADCETAVTDDINAKIGNLTENSNDMNRFEAANSRLKELLNSLTPSRKTGSISQRKNVLTELERKVAVGNGIPNALQSIQDKLQDENQKYNQLKHDLEIAQKEQIHVSEMQAILAKKEQWENLKKEVHDARKKFVGEIPAMDCLEKVQTNYTAMEKAAERSTTYEMTELEKEQLASLQMMFHREVPEEQDITSQLSNVQTLGMLRTEILKTELESKKHEEGTKKKPALMVAGMGIAILGVLIAILGIIATVTKAVGAGIVLALGGVISAIIGSLKEKKISQVESETQELEKKQCASLKTKAAQLRQNICEFLEKFGVYAEEDAFTNQLHELKNHVSKYVFLQDKKQKLLKAKSDYEQNHNEIMDFLIKYGYVAAHNLQLQLLNIRDDVQVYTEACKKKSAFEKKIDVSALDIEIQNEKMKSLSELNAQIAALTEEKDASAKRMRGYNIDLEELQRQYEEWEENKIRLDQLRTLQAQEIQKYHNIQKVQEYLGKAKESITNRYSAPILEHFKAYYEMIASDAADKFYIDANINITKDEQGKQRDINTLSSGYKDLIGVCLRVALVDAMYKEERPVLIMDDPFINLDDEKLEKARKFLKYVAEKYQVIYFTCSNMRM